MDETDQKLLSALRHDARASLSELAGRLNLSRTTVRTRLEKLRERGEIVGFGVITRADVQRDPVRALMMIGIEGRGTEAIMRRLHGMPEVRALHSTNGRWDIIIEIGAETLERLDEILFAIRRLDGVLTSETNLLLSTRKRA